MSDTPLPQLKTYMPSTFAERGVLVPFTTPALSGARVRSQDHAGVQAVLPRPSGGVGFYVVPLPSLNHFCRPTVHDRRLAQRLETLTEVTPATIRRTARDVAIEGLAGREAQMAAQAALRRDQDARALTSFLLMLALWERVQPQGIDPTGFTAPDQELQIAGQRAVAAHAARLGLVADRLPLHLEEAGAIFSGVGVHHSTHPARVLTQLETLVRVHQGIAAWSRARPHGSGEVGGMVAEVAGATVACTTAALRDARLATRDAVALIQQSPANRAVLTRIAERPEWLLDGWQPICQLWNAATTDAERTAALDEIAMLVPVLPKETGEWVRVTIRAESLFTYRSTVLVREDWRVSDDRPDRPQGRQTVKRNQDWRTSSVIDFVVRNELMRALSP